MEQTIPGLVQDPFLPEQNKMHGEGHKQAKCTGVTNVYNDSNHKCAVYLNGLYLGVCAGVCAQICCINLPRFNNVIVPYSVPAHCSQLATCTYEILKLRYTSIKKQPV